MSLDGLKSDFDGIALRVKNFILSSLHGDPTELYNASSFYITSGGKRLRPFMVIKSCEMFGGKEMQAIPAAAAVELVHNFSLIHDDIMDNDDVRHGVSTVHKQYGVPLALLAGDILFSKAFQILSSSGTNFGSGRDAISEMILRLATACISVCEGQAIDTGMAGTEFIPSVDLYLDMIRKKTAALFEVSCGLGVLCAGASEKDVENLSQFGRNAGIAFQLIDDLMGVAGDPRLTGKAVGNDIREGKKTYPILLAINSAGNDKNDIMKVYGSRNSSEEDLQNAVKIICSLGIGAEVRAIARGHMKKALEYINSYPDTDARRALESSARFIVERSL
ncbi:MAG: polyprenyl synthetase family protein [Thermoproteota archaeon]|nr:polyprenyl synthetase family protein [Thermoproteota archaeon]